MDLNPRFGVLPLSLLLTCACASRPPTAASGATETIAIRVNEGTHLAFDVSPDGKSIAFDLLGQLWLVPASGGAARPITDAVRDVAEDMDPSFSPDGRRVAFNGERNGRTGLWLLDLESGSIGGSANAAPPHPAGVVRQLTQLKVPTGHDGNAAWSPDGRVLAFMRVVPPESADSRWRTAVMLLDVDDSARADHAPGSSSVRELSVTGVAETFLRDPAWSPDGKRIAFVAGKPGPVQGGRVWIVDSAGGQATPVTAESVRALAPAFAPDGGRVAYFASDSSDRTQVWVQDVSGAAGSATRVTDHADVTPTRIRWTPDGSNLLYSADGRLWKVSGAGGKAAEIPFTAELTLTRARRSLPPARFPEPGHAEPARGFMGLALSPDGRRIGVLALGKLWVIPVGGAPRAVADVPFEATSLAWSSDGAEVAWSAGVPEREDLFATDLTTGATRRVTALPGREAYPAYSPDGRHLAFVHQQADKAVLRAVDPHASDVGDVARTRDLGSVDSKGTTPPQWSPESDGLLLSSEASETEPAAATFVPLSGERQTVKPFADAPIFLQWTARNTILFVRHDRLWQAPFTKAGMTAEPQPLGDGAALYASASRDGTLLFVSEGGLRLRSPDGVEQRLGWPLSYTPAVAEPTLIRNVRIVDGTGGPMTAARDILIERGRISRIAPAGSLPPGGSRVIDAAERVAIPGLIDLHAHMLWPGLLPGFLYFGVTTLRDQGASMAPLVAYADAMAAEALQGPRVGYGGFQFYSDWAFDDEQGRGIEPEADAGHIGRALTLAEAFGAQHVKTRTFRRWDINARIISEAHRRGLRATGHCAHLLPLVAAGMDAKEHFGICEPRGDSSIYDDLIQLYRAADIGVVPTIVYLDFAVRLNERPALLEEDAEVAPFLPDREAFGWMLKLDGARREMFVREARQAPEATAKLFRGGVTIGTGTDIWQIPTGVHMELEELVAAGLTPAQAIRAGTGAAARILGAEKDLGTIEPGKWADLILLDADPLADIRNTRRIWQVLHYGRIVDRPGILGRARPK